MSDHNTLTLRDIHLGLMPHHPTQYSLGVLEFYFFVDLSSCFLSLIFQNL